MRARVRNRSTAGITAWIGLALGLILAAGCATPASAGYCEDTVPALGTPLPPVRGCTTIASHTIAYEGGSSTLYVMRAGDVPESAGITELATRVMADIASQTGERLRAVGSLRLPPTIHVVIAGGSYSADRPVHAWTGRQSAEVRSREDHDCPMLLFEGAPRDANFYRRTIAHELFHCAQHETLWDRTEGNEGDWWKEGSAEWFEDFVFPSLVSSSDLNEAIERFAQRTREGWSMLEMSYGMSVFFAWLHQGQGPNAVSGYLAQMAGPGESQLTAARRALAHSSYDNFAQAYVDDEIIFPSGTRVDGELGPTLSRTRGEPESDPDIERRPPRPMSLLSGRVEFVPGGYRPKGQSGGSDKIFSERPGEWAKLPASLLIRCGEARIFRYATVALDETPPLFKVKPGTDKATQCGDCGATGGEVRRAGCVVGSWRMLPGTAGNCHVLSGLVSSMPGASVSTDACEPGEGSVSFNRDGSFEGTLDNARRRVDLTFTARSGRSSSTMTIENVIARAKTAGLWRADDESGSLRLCNASTTGLGSMTMSGMEEADGTPVSRTRPMGFGPSPTLDLQFRCARDRMTITVPPQGVHMSGFSVDLERIGPPPEPAAPPPR